MHHFVPQLIYIKNVHKDLPKDLDVLYIVCEFDSDCFISRFSLCLRTNLLTSGLFRKCGELPETDHFHKFYQLVSD